VFLNALTFSNGTSSESTPPWRLGPQDDEEGERGELFLSPFLVVLLAALFIVHSTESQTILKGFHFYFLHTFVRGPVYTDICVLFGFKTRVGY
jgi:hypothetical protein